MFNTLRFGILVFSVPLLCENVKITIHTLQLCVCFYVLSCLVARRATKRKYGTRKGEIEESQRKLHNEEVSNFYSSLGMIKSQKMRWAALSLGIIT